MTYTRANIQVTQDLLADGREIFYFDEGASPTRPHDRRRLSHVVSQSSMRFDRLAGEWVTIASHRQERTHLPSDRECPLCPSKPHRATEIPADAYDVVVFENRFPSFAQPATSNGDVHHEFFEQRPAAGRCEVLCFTSDHTASFPDLPPSRVRTVLEAWIERTEALSRIPTVEQVFCFENRGKDIGVTLAHPHGQIYAYPFVTPRVERALSRARAEFERAETNIFAEALKHELNEGVRVVLRGEHWSAFVPFAARWPVEVHLYPNRRCADLPELNDDERAEFPTVYLELLQRIEAAFGRGMPYIAAWHQAPIRRDRDLAYLHLELFSIRRAPNKLKYLAGSESGMGAFINDLTPEETARKICDVRL